MKWSQLKKRMEKTFADSVRGRFEVWVTSYRDAHDDAGEAWITLDQQKIVTLSNLRFQIAHYETAQRLRKERDCLDYRDPTRVAGYREAWDDATKILHEAGTFDSHDLPRSMFAYLNLSIDNALKSDNPIIRAFAVLDRRCGKRRLCAFDVSNEHLLVSQLYRFRCLAEGIRLSQLPHAPATDGA
jgi:hypothetical protein